MARRRVRKAKQLGSKAATQCPLWVISNITRATFDVRFVARSGHLKRPPDRSAMCHNRKSPGRSVDFTFRVSHPTSVDLISADETGIIYASTARLDCEAARRTHSGMPAIRQACDNLSISSALRNLVFSGNTSDRLLLH